MTYQRPPGTKQGDFTAARAWEEKVASFLPPYVVTRFSHNDELDIWVPGPLIECKEKKQPLTDRWWLLPGVEERNLFIMDELSLRRCMKAAPHTYIIINDVPCDRLFILNAVEMACAERTRRNRNGKGKLIYNLTDFRRLPHLDQLLEFVMADMADLPWKRSECWSANPIGEIAR